MGLRTASDQERVYTASVVAIRSGVVWSVPSVLFRRLLANDPQLLFAVALVIASRVVAAEQRLHALLSWEAPDRVARQIMQWGEVVGEPDEAGHLVMVGISNLDIAVPRTPPRPPWRARWPCGAGVARSPPDAGDWW